jgi:hypothetical protein
MANGIPVWISYNQVVINADGTAVSMYNPLGRPRSDSQTINPGGSSVQPGRILPVPILQPPPEVRGEIPESQTSLPRSLPIGECPFDFDCGKELEPGSPESFESLTSKLDWC